MDGHEGGKASHPDCGLQHACKVCPCGCVHAGVLSSMAEDRLRGPKFSISHSHTKNLKSKNKQVNSQSREKEWAEILPTEGICALLKALALGPAERADLSVVPWERISEHR